MLSPFIEGGIMVRITLLISILLCAVVSPGFSKVADSCQPGTTKMSDGTTMHFRLYIPRNYSNQYKYPLVMVMHGIGECGTDDSIQVDHEYITHQWMLDSVKSKYQAFVLYPQCPSSSYEWGYFNTGTAAQKGYAALPAVAAVNVIDSLIKVYPIDTTRLYIGGLSWGGLGTEALMMSYPTKFAAAFPCAGENYLDSVKVMTKSPFWMFHGLADGTVPVTRDTQFVTAVIQSGIPVVKFYASQDSTAGPNFTVSNPTGISVDSLNNSVVNGAEYLFFGVNNGNHNSGWHMAFYSPFLVPWLMSKSRVNGNTVFTWPAPGPGSVTAVSEMPKPLVPGESFSAERGIIRWEGVSHLPARITLFSARGSLLKRYLIGSSKGELVCSGLPAGVYLVGLETKQSSLDGSRSIMIIGR